MKALTYASAPLLILGCGNGKTNNGSPDMAMPATLGPAPMLAVACADTVDAVYTLPSGLPAMDDTHRGDVFHCAVTESLTAAKVNAQINAFNVGYTNAIGGNVTITPGKQNDTMRVSIHGMPKNSGFDLFVIEEPNKPFGISWYQSDINAGRDGRGSATVKGIFDRETFSVSPALSPTVSFAPTHQFHLGLWFNNPNTPFKLGCEPNGPNDKPIVTPFNGEQHAGIQVLNTAEFPDNAGPLSHVHR